MTPAEGQHKIEVMLRVRHVLADMRNALDAAEGYIKELRTTTNQAVKRAEEAEKLATTAERDRDRAKHANERAATAEQLIKELTPKAERLDDLEEACRKMLSALDKLPVSMDKAGVMQTITPPAIPLYGTYEWKAVMNAKFDLIQAMGKEGK